MKNYFEYNVGQGIVQPGDFRISASQLSRFFDETSQWYREFLLGESGFQGSTASELGNLVHASAAMYIDSGYVGNQQLLDYIDSITNPEVDKSILLAQYKPMIEALINDYLAKTHIDESESFLWKELTPGIGVGGSCDARAGTTVIDFKTTSAKTPPKSISRAYWFQLMTYAWLYKQKGIDIQYIKIVYVTRSETGRYSEKTGKPLKDYPSQVVVLTEEVTEHSLELIESCIKLIAESVNLWKTQPELRHILAQDMRLKPLPRPILFKN